MYSSDEFDKMDLFYLGLELDPETGGTTSLPLLYKSKNLEWLHLICWNRITTTD